MSGLLRRTAQLAGTATIMVLCLFLPAGTFHWASAWWYLGSYLAVLVISAFALLPGGSEVIEERSNRAADQAPWDRAITWGLTLVTVAYLVVAGLDRRFGWTPAPPPALLGAGVVLFVAGYGLVVWSIRVNTFFSKAARIQAERGHAVVTSGPYSAVRHPGYLGMALNALGTASILGSVFGLAYLAGFWVLIVARTALEDRMLTKGLPGYRDYRTGTRYRLVPGVW